MLIQRFLSGSQPLSDDASDSEHRSSSSIQTRGPNQLMCIAEGLASTETAKSAKQRNRCQPIAPAGQLLRLRSCPRPSPAQESSESTGAADGHKAGSSLESAAQKYAGNSQPHVTTSSASRYGCQGGRYQRFLEPLEALSSHVLVDAILPSPCRNELGLQLVRWLRTAVTRIDQMRGAQTDDGKVAFCILSLRQSSVRAGLPHMVLQQELVRVPGDSAVPLRTEGCRRSCLRFEVKGQVKIASAPVEPVEIDPDEFLRIRRTLQVQLQTPL